MGAEAVRFEKDSGVLQIHHILLARNGTHILENRITGLLVKEKAWEFVVVLGAARITGGV